MSLFVNETPTYLLSIESQTFLATFLTWGSFLSSGTGMCFHFRILQHLRNDRAVIEKYPSAICMFLISATLNLFELLLGVNGTNAAAFSFFGSILYSIVSLIHMYRLQHKTARNT